MLNKKRVAAIEAISAASLAGGFTTFVPTPAIEVHKQVVLGAADIAMCTFIWRKYFEEELDNKGILQQLGFAGVIAVAAGGTGWVIAKGASGLLGELTNLLGPLGWWVSGLVASSGTATLGLAWMMFCDKRFRKLNPTIKEKPTKQELKELWAAFKKLFGSLKPSKGGPPPTPA